VGIGNIRQPEFGQRLRHLRTERGISQRDLAGSVVNPSYISLLESGARVPTLEVVVQLAEALGVPLEDLVERSALPARGLLDQAHGGRLVVEILAGSSLDFGNLADAQARFREAYEDARREDAVLSAFEYGVTLQEVLRLAAAHEERYVLVEQLAEYAERLGFGEAIVKVDIDRAAAARDTNRLSEALELAQRAAKRIGDTELTGTSEHVRLLGVLISIYTSLSEASEIAPLVDEMLRISQTLDSPSVLGRAHWVACVAFAQIGEAQLAERHVRYAKEMLASPATPLRDWARFARAAASALLDAEADLAEVEQYMAAARATLSMVEVPEEKPRMRVLEARFALAAGDPSRALELAAEEPPGLGKADLVRLYVARGRALLQIGKVADGVAQLRAATGLCEELGAYRLATQIWREIDATR
jgi:transcriptional regulator with XRE-family HTH domain